MQPVDLLQLWEKTYPEDPLSAGLRTTFLNKKETRLICGYHSMRVARAVKKHKTLKAILEYLQQSDPVNAQARHDRPVPREQPEPRKAPTSRAAPSPRKQPRPRKATATPKRRATGARGTRGKQRKNPVLSNTDEYISATGSGTIRQWGKRTERHRGALRYCPSCGLLEEACTC